MKGNVLCIILTLFLLGSCGYKSPEENKEVNNISDQTLLINNDDKLINDNSGLQKYEIIKVANNVDANILFQKVDYNELDITQLLDYFSHFNVVFDNIGQIKNYVLNDDGTFKNALDYDIDKYPETPSLGWYVYDNKLRMITTTMMGGKSDLVLRTLDMDGKVTDTILIDDILYLEPFYAYNKNKLYYSAVSKDNTSKLGVIDLTELKPQIIKNYKLTLDDDKYTGEIITKISNLNGKIVYQLSSYDNLAMRTTKPMQNKIIELNNNRVIDIGNDSYDSIISVGSYVITHDRAYDEDYVVKIYDKDYNLLYQIDDEKIGQLTGAMLISKDNKDYILFRDLTGLFYLIDVDNEDNYKFTNMETLDRNVNIEDERLIIVTENDTYVTSYSKGKN